VNFHDLLPDFTEHPTGTGTKSSCTSFNAFPDPPLRVSICMDAAIKQCIIEIPRVSQRHR
jgi:hypothetical protein